MKKLLAILMALVLALAFVACGEKEVATGDDTVVSGDLAKIQDAGVIKIGMECDYAPFNWTQTDASDYAEPIAVGGYADGYDVQIAKKIAEGLGVKVEIVKTGWEGLIPALQAGEIDGIIAGMSPTAERKATIDFTDNYYESQLVVVMKKDSPFASATSIHEFAGAKITGQLNTFHETVIEQMDGVDKQVSMETFPAMIVALQSGVIDGYISERPGAVSAVAANPDLTFVEFSEGNGFVASPDDVAIAVGIRKGSDLATPVNEILAGISNDDRQALMDEVVARQPVTE